MNPPTLNPVQSNIDLELYQKIQAEEQELYNDSPCQEARINPQLMKNFLNQSPNAADQDLSHKFTKALQRYIKKEVSNAVVKNHQYFSSPTQRAAGKSTKQTAAAEGLTDITFDTVFGVERHH